MMRRFLIAADRRGSMVAEAALMIPLLAGMLCGAADIASGFVMKLRLEQAAGRAIELATAPGTVSTSYANLPGEAGAAYGRPYRSATVDNWLECGGVRQGSFTSVCANGDSARYISVRIEDDYVPIFNYGGLFKGSGPGGAFIVRGDAVVRVQ